MARDFHLETLAAHQRSVDTAPDLGDALDAMLADSEQMDAFLEWSGYSLGGLMAILCSRGLPSMSGSERDDRLHDALYGRIEQFKAAFTAWTNEPRGNQASRLDQYAASMGSLH